MAQENENGVLVGQDGTQVGGNIMTPTCEPERKSNWKARGFTMVLWNDEALERVKDLNPTYLAWAPENCPSTGKFHWQTYAWFKNPRSVQSMGKLIAGIGSSEPSVGTPERNREYVFGPFVDTYKNKHKPENPDAKEVGTLPVQGKRNDLESFVDAIREGKRGLELLDHIETRAKYPKLEQTLVSEFDEERAHKMYNDGIFPEVHVIWGRHGTGKTRQIYDKYGSANVYRPRVKKCGQSWWTGYNGQDVILFDDYYGQIDWGDFLQLLDIYPIQFESKGGMKWRLASKIYITSNRPPNDWYPAQGEEIGALMRRCTSVTHVE